MDHVVTMGLMMPEPRQMLLVQQEGDTIEPVLRRGNGQIELIRTHGCAKGRTLYEIRVNLTRCDFYKAIWGHYADEVEGYFLSKFMMVDALFDNPFGYSDPLRLKLSSGHEVDAYGPVLFTGRTWGASKWREALTDLNVDEILAILT